MPPTESESVPRRIAANPPGGARVDIVEAARRLALELFYVPSMANGWESAPAEERGNAILSSLPLADLAAIPYEAQRRVAVAATLRGTTTLGLPWDLRVVSLHIDHRSRGPR